MPLLFDKGDYSEQQVDYDGILNWPRHVTLPVKIGAGTIKMLKVLAGRSSLSNKGLQAFFSRTA